MNIKEKRMELFDKKFPNESGWFMSYDPEHGSADRIKQFLSDSMDAVEEGMKLDEGKLTITVRDEIHKASGLRQDVEINWIKKLIKGLAKAIIKSQGG